MNIIGKRKMLIIKYLIYKNLSFGFCVGSENESPVENLGQVIFGERIRPSPYKVFYFIKKNFL